MTANNGTGHLGEFTQARIDEIKRVWNPGMSASEIARAVDWKVWNTDQGFISRNAVIGMFHRHAKKLAPCELPSSNAPSKGRKKRKKQLSKPILAKMPELDPAPEPASMDNYQHIDTVPMMSKQPGMNEAAVAAVPAYTPDKKAELRFRIDQMMERQDAASARRWDERLADKRVVLPTLDPKNNKKMRPE